MLLLVFMFSCDQSETTKIVNNTNALLHTNVSSEYEFINVNEDFPHWTENFKANEFYTDLCNSAMEGKIKVFSDNGDEFSIAQVKATLGEYTDTLMIEDPVTFEFKKELIEHKANLNNITGMYFKENWFFNEAEFRFTKEIIEYYPVLTKLSNIDTTQYSKFLAFAVKKNNFNSDKSVLLASGIITEYNFNDTLESTILSGMDLNKFRTLLVDKSLESKNVYNPDNLELMNVAEIKQSLGSADDTLLLEDAETGEYIQQIIKGQINLEDIENIIFIEDWYIDKASFNIRKEIIGIAPILYTYKYYDGDMSVSKKIPFVYYFSDIKPVIIK